MLSNTLKAISQIFLGNSDSRTRKYLDSYGSVISITVFILLLMKKLSFIFLFRVQLVKGYADFITNIFHCFTHTHTAKEGFMFNWHQTNLFSHLKSGKLCFRSYQLKCLKCSEFISFSISIIYPNVLCVTS